MSLFSTRRLALLILLGVGCTSSDKRKPIEPLPPIVGRGTPSVPKPLAIPDKSISPARQKDTPDDQGLLIPPPPMLEELNRPAKDIQPPTDVQQASLLTSNTDSRNEVPAKIGDESLETMQRIYQRSVAAYAKISAFEARLTRRESVHGKPMPQEIIHFKFRKEPYSVYLKWIGDEGKGREVVFVQGGKMNVMPSKSDAFPLPPMRMSFLPDDPMIRSKSRHDIREAGLSESIRKLGNSLDIIAKDPKQRGRLRLLGLVTRPEYATPMEAIEEIIPANSEQLLPEGGKRASFFDTSADARSAGLPVLVITHDAKGKEVEYYLFDRFLISITLKDADFDAEKLWKK